MRLKILNRGRVGVRARVDFSAGGLGKAILASGRGDEPRPKGGDINTVAAGGKARKKKSHNGRVFFLLYFTFFGEQPGTSRGGRRELCCEW